MQINILQARNRLSQLVKAAQAGEEVIIANRGEPVVRMVPVTRAELAPDTGDGAAVLAWLERNPLPPYARRSAEDIDAAIDEERSAWE